MPPPPPSKPLEEFAAQEEAIAELRRANNRLSKKLYDERGKKAELVDAVYRACKDAAAGLQWSVVPKPPRERRKHGDEVAVPLVSDLQLAKVTPDYDSEVCEQRMELYADKIIEMTEIQRSDHPVKVCSPAFLGDIIEGECIFPGQAFLIDSGLYRQIAVDGPRIVINFLRKLLGHFDRVDVDWVIGNHGRIGRRGDFDPESNGDRMLGRIVADRLEDEPRITFRVPDGKRERNWYAIKEVGAWRALMIHGDQVKGHSGFPWYGLGKKVNGWASGSIPEEFQDVLMGHWHQRAAIPLNKRTVYVNGSTESYNTFAQENLAAMSDPSQWLLFVHPGHGQVTAEYGVRL